VARIIASRVSSGNKAKLAVVRNGKKQETTVRHRGAAKLIASRLGRRPEEGQVRGRTKARQTPAYIMVQRYHARSGDR